MTFNAGSVTSTLGIDINPFAKGMLQASGIMSVFPQTVTNFLANPILGAIGVAQDLAGAIGGAINEGIKLAAANEQVAISYEVMLQSAEKAKALMDEIRQFANTTPFRLEEINNAGKQLLAFGFAGEEVVPTLRRLGDVSAALNIPLGDLAYLFGTTKVQGRLFAQDLNQFVSRGIPLIDQLATQFGVAKSEVKKLVEEGKVGFPEVEAALRALTDEGGLFAGMTQRQSESALGLWSTLEDAITDAKMKMGEAVLEGLDVKSLVKDITAFVEDMKPVVADLVKTAVEGLRVAMPLLRETLQTVRDLAIAAGLVDVNKLYGNPYQQPEKAQALAGLQANSQGVDQMQVVFDSYTAAMRDIEAGYAEFSKVDPVAGAATQAVLKRNYDRLRSQIDDLRRQAREGDIDKEAFAATLAQVQKLVQRFQELRQGLVTAATETQLKGDRDAAGKMSESVRKAGTAVSRAEDVIRGGQGSLDDQAKWAETEKRTREAAKAEADARAKAMDEELDRMIEDAYEEAFAPELKAEPPKAARTRPPRTRVGGGEFGAGATAASQISAASIDPAINAMVLSFTRGAQQIDRAVSEFVRRLDAAQPASNARGGARQPQINVDVDVPLDVEAVAKVLTAKLTPHVNQVVRSQVNRLAEATRQQMYAQAVKEGL